MLLRLAVCLLVSLRVLLVQSGAATSSQSPAASVSPSLPPLVNDPSWPLGVRLYQALRSDPGSVNTLFSPLLLASSLEALSEEAVGGLLSVALESFVKANGTSFQIHASSCVFTKQAPAVGQAFAKEIQSRFRLQHRTLGKGDAKADLRQLCEWAEAALGGKEGAPLEAEIKAKAGAIFLTNALHFKGRYRFHEDVDNMVQVLEAPLWGGRASLVLLLPFHVENLARLDKLLTPELLSKWLERTAVTGVALSLPKANISSSLSLQNKLLTLTLSGRSGGGGGGGGCNLVLKPETTPFDTAAALRQKAGGRKKTLCCTNLHLFHERVCQAEGNKKKKKKVVILVNT
uniref:Serine (or cysteine) peptidase inhibitor, clade H, member 2 n=1 Tax=Poecilia latipinna TaxID=48699 RepID=A0A3B3U2B1_9TELE